VAELTKKETDALQREGLTHAWVRNKKVFPGKPNAKRGFAFYLITIGAIKVRESRKDEALKNPIPFLESKGWKWKRIVPYKAGFYWTCHWDNGKGGFNPDYEGCSSRGKIVPTLADAVRAAKKHAATHGYGGWGYAPHNWHPEISIIARDGKGRERDIGDAFEKSTLKKERPMELRELQKSSTPTPTKKAGGMDRNGQ